MWIERISWPVRDTPENKALHAFVSASLLKFGNLAAVFCEVNRLRVAAELQTASSGQIRHYFARLRGKKGLNMHSAGASRASTKESISPILRNATDNVDVDNYQAAVPLEDISDEEEHVHNHNMAFLHDLAEELDPDDVPEWGWSSSESDDDDYQTIDDEGEREEVPNPLKKHRHMARQQPEAGEEEGNIILLL